MTSWVNELDLTSLTCMYEWVDTDTRELNHPGVLHIDKKWDVGSGKNRAA